MEFFLFLPQMRLGFDALVERARAAEAAGFTGITGMDHLAPPMAEDQPMYEAFVTATWQAAHTSTLTVGHLVLCDAFRHPAVLARQSVSLDHASGGRFELGIGWGSVPREFEVFGTGSTEARARVDRLAETLEVLEALWSGEALDHDGAYFTLRGARQVPAPLSRIPIVIGGVGKRTLGLVARHADWWNVPVGSVARLDEMRPHTGDARVSVQQMIAFVPDGSARDDVAALARRRFGHMGDELLIGNGDELLARFDELSSRGVERVYAWFADFAPPSTLAAFGEQVIVSPRR